MQIFRRLINRFRQRDAADGQPDKNAISCIVKYLDDTEGNFIMNKESLGKDMYERVYNDLDFQYEHEYFGLQYTDFHNIHYWLDPTKSLKKQVKKTMPGPPYTFRFVVKFFSSEPDSYLKEELTRYLYVLQLKSDLASGRLIVNDEEKAAELAALVIQSEEGDYDPDKHDLAFVSQFRFLPLERQTEEFEMIVFEEYGKLVDRNLTPALCEKMYLSKVKYLDNYGIDMHKVQGKDDRTYQLGLTPAGILVYDGDEKIGFFFWQRIVKIAFNRANLKIVVTEDDAQGSQQDHTFVFKLVDARTCKHLWRCAVEHHTFFRLVQPKAPPSKAKQLLRLRSRFYHSFRTESGLVQANQFGTSQRRSARFERKPSTRHSSRPSFTRSDAERRLLRPNSRPAQHLAVENMPSVVAEVDETETNIEAGKPETIETRAIIVTTGMHDEDDAEEGEFTFDAMRPQASPPARIVSGNIAGSSEPASPVASVTPVSIVNSSPLPPPGPSGYYSSSGQSDSSSSAMSQRTVIEVAPPQVALSQHDWGAARPTEPLSSPSSGATTNGAGRRPPQASGLRQPSAIPKMAVSSMPASVPAPAVAAPTTPGATSDVGKSVSISALPAPKVLVQKQLSLHQQSAVILGATVSASSLPRRLSASGSAAPADLPPTAAAAAARSDVGGSRIPAPASAAAAAAPPPGRSRIPAPAPPAQAAPSSSGSSGLPQPKAGGMSGIPRLAAAPTAVVPQFSLSVPFIPDKATSQVSQQQQQKQPSKLTKRLITVKSHGSSGHYCQPICKSYRSVTLGRQPNRSQQTANTIE